MSRSIGVDDPALLVGRGVELGRLPSVIGTGGWRVDGMVGVVGTKQEAKLLRLGHNIRPE